MGARTGGWRIGQLSSLTQPDEAAVFRRRRRVTERHLTQKGRVRKQRRYRRRAGARAQRPLLDRLRHEAAASPRLKPADAALANRKSDRRYPKASVSAPCSASPAAAIFRIAIIGRERTRPAPNCTRLVIALIFCPLDLASYTPLADIPASQLRQGFAASATDVARFMRCQARRRWRCRQHERNRSRQSDMARSTPVIRVSQECAARGGAPGLVSLR